MLAMIMMLATSLFMALFVSVAQCDSSHVLKSVIQPFILTSKATGVTLSFLLSWFRVARSDLNQARFLT